MSKVARGRFIASGLQPCLLADSWTFGSFFAVSMESRHSFLMTFQCYADVQLVPPSAVLADRMKSKAVPTVAARLRTKAVETQYHRDVDLPVSVNRLHVTAPIPRPVYSALYLYRCKG